LFKIYKTKSSANFLFVLFGFWEEVGPERINSISKGECGEEG